MNTQSHPVADVKDDIPGDIALWFFLCAELGVFGLLIIGFALLRLFQPEMVASGLQQLHLHAGIINTMALLTGSWLAAVGVQQVRRQQPEAGRYFVAAAAAGMIYIIVKLSEYTALYQQGYSLHYDAFFGFYFFATFFHFLHVLAGILFLLLVARWLKNHRHSPADRTKTAENVALYWHMVDLVWIVLFPTLYLLR
ncbi:cytochrome c oxidase subunit 3 [Venatoribacter cucullus]|uniref:cytochrome c oxidase subunit 3 n=1 Tax=Venatoribacter cucullus TaxID=2661630 RepID=UPI00223EBECB|nr:cytochrome c oxidase subunit 3 [Venatoribacter cucullus]UZK03936.1 hypothetical protein GAY96_08555 [Venatoribacter cucullus]